MSRGRSGCLLGVFIIAAAGFLLFLFRFELAFIRNLLFSLAQASPVETLGDISQATKVTIYISENVLAIVFFTWLIFYWIGRSVFPVRNSQQINTLVQRIFPWSSGVACLFVREGVLTGEINGARSNLVIVDLNSAIVIESLHARPAPAPKLIEVEPYTELIHPSSARVHGPGLTILRPGERLRDVVNLRKQFRNQLKVRGQTKDGIDLSTNVFLVFTLGEQPDVIQVIYDGEPEARNLRLLQIDPATRRIIEICDELDPADQAEIHHFAQEFIYYLEPTSLLHSSDQNSDAPPFHLDEARILAAVYSRARNVKDGTSISHWTDLPVMVAAETFRNMIHRYTLDELYTAHDPAHFPLQNELKPGFERRIRFMGVLAFQFIQRSDGEPPQIGQRVDHRYFRIAAPQTFRNPKVLRDCGIKVTRAGFAELSPTDPKVNQQRMEMWLARWQQKSDSSRSDQYQEVIQVMNRARLEKEHELIGKLSRIIQSPQLSEEAALARFLQELDRISQEANTKQLLNQEILQAFSKVKEQLLVVEPGEPPAQSGPKGEG